MRNNKFNYHRCLAISAFVVLIGCHAKGSSSEDNQTSPVALPGSASVEGLPTNPSAAQKLSVSVLGPSLINYRYALQNESTLCNNAQLSEERPGSELITDDLGTDSSKTLCIVAVTSEGKEEKASSFSYTWLKDSSPPAITFEKLDGYGPHKQSGNTFSIAMHVSDSLSKVANVMVSVTDGQACLGLTSGKFDARCPIYTLPPKTSENNYLVSIPDSAFTSGLTYKIVAQASDAVGNDTALETSLSFLWNSSEPAPVPSLTAISQQQQVSLQWPAVTGVSKYVIVRRAGSAVSNIPAPGDSLSVGYPIGNENYVACVTLETSCTDMGLDAFTWYFYEVIAFDSAGNRAATGGRATVQTLSEAKFQGLTRVSLSSPNRTVSAEWQTFLPTGSNSSSITYGLFESDTSNAQNFSNSIASSVGQESVEFADTGSSNNLYFTARQWSENQIQDKNTREIRLKMGPGIHHKLTSSGRFLGQDPLGQTFLSSVWATAVDPFGNIIFGGAPGRINVICKELTKAYYCKSRQLEKIYTFAGTDGSDDGGDANLGSATPTGEPYGITFDSYGNMFLADSTNFRVRAYCYDPTAPGFCNRKIVGYSYHLAGTGSSVDGLDDSVAKTTGIGVPYGIAVDSKGNVYIADNTFRKIRVICSNILSGVCAGKVSANLYNLAGTGIAGDAADNLPGLAANLGNIGALTIDSLGNLFFSDLTYSRIRAICITTVGTSHFCAGKTALNSYRVSGTGSLGDGANNTLATTTALSNVNGLAITPGGNLFISDNSVAGNRLRVICYNVSTDYYCNGRTSGNSFRISGTGASTDGANNSLAVSVAIGSPRGLALDLFGNLVFADATNRRIRLHCSSSLGALCNGKLPDYHYYIAGVGPSSLGWNLNAFLTPVGLPQGLAEDHFGNIYFADATNFVARVICYDVSHDGFCFNKSAGFSYVIAGNGVSGNAVDNVLAQANSIGLITGVEIDPDGNLYLADNTNRTVRLVCGTTIGSCVGKSTAFMYRFIGNTSAADSVDNTVATASGLGQVADISLDAQENIWLADSQYFRVRLYCRNLNGLCSGKTVGNIYRVLGTGITGNALDAVIGSTGAFGILTSIDADPWNNIILGDSGNFFVRVYCNNGLGGYCATKASPSGKIYRAIGTGVTGDSISDTSSSSTIISAMNAVQSDDKGNIYVAESTNRRLRVLCVDTASTYCVGLTPGNSYRMIGSGLSGDASSGATGSSAKIDTPSRDSLHFTANGRHLLYEGGGTPTGLGSIRVFLGYK